MLRPRCSIPTAGFALASLLALASFAAPSARAEDGAMPPAPGGGPAVPPPAPPAAPDPKAGPPPPSGRFFDTFDANQDGKVTKEEFTGDPEVFVFLDKDGDGVVTLVELGLPADYKPRPLPKEQDEQPPGGKGGAERSKRLEEFKARLATWDTDKDGKVTKEEYKGKAAFETLDRNHDGVLTMDDLRGPGEGGGPGGAPMSAEDVARRFKEADKNGDGKVTADEFPGPPERFAMIDKDKDGAITQEELAAAMKAMAAGGEGGKGGKRMMMRLDKDGDGKVSRTEFPGGDEGFAKLDKNKDGFITPDEVEGMEPPKGLKGKKGEPGKPGEGNPGEPGAPPTTPSMPGGEHPPGGMPAPGGAPAPGTTGGGLGTLFSALDKDHDGKLSRAEFPGTDDEWRRLDRDGNGWITADEAR